MCVCVCVCVYICIILLENSVDCFFPDSGQTPMHSGSGCFQELQSLGYPSYVLVAHMSCQTFGSGCLVPGQRGESVVCLRGLQLGSEVLTHLITGKRSLSKGGEANGVLYLLPTPSWPDRQTDMRRSGQLACRWTLVLCLRDALHCWQASLPSSRPPPRCRV